MPNDGLVDKKILSRGDPKFCKKKDLFTIKAVNNFPNLKFLVVTIFYQIKIMWILIILMLVHHIMIELINILNNIFENKIIMFQINILKKITMSQLK